MIYKKQRLTQALFQKMVHDITTLIDNWCVEDKQEFYFTKKSHLSRYHHNLGMYIRNTYRLWECTWQPELDEHGCDCSKNHPDQISQLVIETVWANMRLAKDYNANN